MLDQEEGEGRGNVNVVVHTTQNQPPVVDKPLKVAKFFTQYFTGVPDADVATTVVDAATVLYDAMPDNEARDKYARAIADVLQSHGCMEVWLQLYAEAGAFVNTGSALELRKILEGYTLFGSLLRLQVASADDSEYLEEHIQQYFLTRLPKYADFEMDPQRGGDASKQKKLKEVLNDLLDGVGHEQGLYMSQPPFVVRFAMQMATRLSERFMRVNPSMKVPTGMMAGAVFFPMWFSHNLTTWEVKDNTAATHRQCELVAKVLDMIALCNKEAFPEDFMRGLNPYVQSQVGSEKNPGKARSFLLGAAAVDAEESRRKREEQQQAASHLSNDATKAAAAEALHMHLVEVSAQEALFETARKIATTRNLPSAIQGLAALSDCMVPNR